MKRMMIRLAAIGLSLLLCTGAAAATAAGDVSYTVAEKLFKQMDAGSGFKGTLTITADAVEGKEAEAVSTVKPIVLDVTAIQVPGADGEPDETRLTFTLNASEYQQGSAELSLRDGATYMQSSLLSDGWYLVSEDILQPLLDSIGVQNPLPALPDQTQTGVMQGTLQFFLGMTGILTSGTSTVMTEAMQEYTTKIDFWLEGYRESVQMNSLDDGTAAMEIQYRIPPAAVKAQLKQLLVDLMNDGALVAELATLMPEEQAGQFLEPSLQPYYFYAVDELPLEDDLTIRRVMSLLGDTVELSVTMPFYDSVSGAMTLVYTRTQGGEDMPYENAVQITGSDSDLEIRYTTYETMTGATVYQGMVRMRETEKDGIEPQILWISFDLSVLSETAKDLSGYETLHQNFQLSIAPAEISDAVNTAKYIAVQQTNLSLDMRFTSLPAKNAPTDANVTLTVSGEGMAQSVTLALSGATTALWTPESFDAAQAVNLTEMSGEDLQSLLSQAVVKGGLLLLPYINLPKIQTETTD